MVKEPQNTLHRRGYQRINHCQRFDLRAALSYDTSGSMKATSTKQVIKAVGNEHLNLVRGKDYWYFIYDDVAKGRYDTMSIYTMRLGDFTVEQWAQDGREFCAKMERKNV